MVLFQKPIIIYLRSEHEMSPLKLLKAISPPFLYNVAKVIKLKFFNPNKNSFSGPYKSSSEVTYDGLSTVCIFHDLSKIRNYFKEKGYVAIYDLPNFEEVKFVSNFLPQEFFLKYGSTVIRDLILKKND